MTTIGPRIASCTAPWDCHPTNGPRLNGPMPNVLILLTAAPRRIREQRRAARPEAFELYDALLRASERDNAA